MTNREMLEIAMRQSAEDIGCACADFTRNAVKSGFIPAWVEMTAKPAKTVADIVG